MIPAAWRMAIRRILADCVRAVTGAVHGAVVSCAGSAGRLATTRLPESVFGRAATRVIPAAPLAEITPDGPIFHVLMPVCDPPPRDLLRALASVRQQTYGRWRLVCVDDASSDPKIMSVLSGFLATETRMRIVTHTQRRGIALATETARASAHAAPHDWLVFLDHDDLLDPDALARLALAAQTSAAVMLYTDECKVDAGSRLFDAFYKPAWSPALLLGQNYINHLTAVRADVAEAAGGLRAGFDGAQDLDFLLRAAAAAEPDAGPNAGSRRIGHVPGICYAWRRRRRSRAFSQTRAVEAAEHGRRAVLESLARAGVAADVTLTPQGWRCVQPHLAAPVRISVVIATHNNPMFKTALDAAVGATWPDLEIIVVDHENDGADFARLMGEAERQRPVRRLPWRGAFNYAAMMNLAAASATGELILLLNDDVRPLHADWLARMAGWMAFGDVGAVGALLLYPSGLVQHAGLALGIGGSVGAPMKYASSLRQGPFGRLALAREVAAVTGACLLTRRSSWAAVGGMDSETFAVGFNDVDYCLKLWSLGQRVIWTPEARLIHHEGASRGRDVTGARALRLARERDGLAARWGRCLDDDPFFHPVWSRRSEALRPDPGRGAPAGVRFACITPDHAC